MIARVQIDDEPKLYEYKFDPDVLFLAQGDRVVVDWGHFCRTGVVQRVVSDDKAEWDGEHKDVLGRVLEHDDEISGDWLFALVACVIGFLVGSFATFGFMVSKQ